MDELNVFQVLFKCLSQNMVIKIDLMLMYIDTFSQLLTKGLDYC